MIGYVVVTKQQQQQQTTGYINKFQIILTCSGSVQLSTSYLICYRSYNIQNDESLMRNLIVGALDTIREISRLGRPKTHPFINKVWSLCWTRYDICKSNDQKDS